jgi:serine/threonine protein kinase
MIWNIIFSLLFSSLTASSSPDLVDEINRLSAPNSFQVSKLCSSANFLDNMFIDGKYVPAYPVHPRLGRCSEEYFQLKEALGCGAFSTVFKAIHTPTNEVVTLKQLTPKSNEWFRVRMEECMQHRVQFPTIRSHLCTFTTNSKVVLVMEYVDGISLNKFVKQNHPLPNDVMKRWTAQLSVTLMALHLNSVVFMDLTPHNILVTNGGRDIKLIDFGLAGDPNVNIQGQSDGFSGTPYFGAPENADYHLKGRKDHVYLKPAVDWYALGLIIYQACTRKNRFDIKAVKEMSETMFKMAMRLLLENITKGFEVTQEDRLGREDLMDFVQSTTERNPMKRWGSTIDTYPKILGCPLFSDLHTLADFLGTTNGEETVTS